MKFREQVNSRIQSQITQAEIPLPLPLPPPSHFILVTSSSRVPITLHLSLILNLKSESFLHHPLKRLLPSRRITVPFYFQFYLIDNIEVIHFFLIKSNYLIVYLSGRLNLRLPSTILSETHGFNLLSTECHSELTL